MPGGEQAAKRLLTEYAIEQARDANRLAGVVARFTEGHRLWPRRVTAEHVAEARKAQRAELMRSRFFARIAEGRDREAASIRAMYEAEALALEAQGRN